MQTQKKINSEVSIDALFSSLLSNPKPNIFYSESLRDTVEDLINIEPAGEQDILCRIKLSDAYIECKVQEMSTTKRATVINALIASENAWKVYRYADDICEINVNNTGNLLENQKISKVKISRQTSQNLYLLTLKLSKF